LSMIPSGADASVSIKVDVDDAGAQARMAALEARMKALEKQSERSGKAAGSYGQRLDDMSKRSSRADKSNKDLLKTGDALRKMFGGLGKIVKFATIEFGLMTAALGAMQFALWAGQTAMKGFHALLRATGAAAGVAVGAIATVLGALRELQSVKLAPIMGGIVESRTQTNAFFADRRFAMFDQKTMAGILQSAAEQGRVIDATFRNELAKLANYSLGDPKKLAEIQKTFQQMSKDGKVTVKTYEDLRAVSPALAKAFDEMAGGTKKGEAAARAGSVSYQKFFDAVMAGNLEALKPFQGALDNINSTLIGTLKGAFVGVKEQFTRMGEPLLAGLRRPITILEREISLFVLKVNGTVQKVFPTLFDVKDENNNTITRVFDRLATSINTNMGKISGWVESIRGWGRSVSDFFGKLGNGLRHYSRGWDKLFEGILRPFGQEFVSTLSHLFDTFNKLIEDQPLGSFERMIRAVGEAVRNLITGFGQLKAAIAPVFAAFSNILGVLAKLTSLPGIQFLIPMLLMGRFMRGRAGGGGGMGAVGAAAGASMFASATPGMGLLGMAAMPLMMGMSGFGTRTRYGAASAGNYAANRAAGAGRIPSALFSSPLGFGFASNRRDGMGRGVSAMLAGSAARGAMAQGFVDRRGRTITGSVAATQQARIDALMANRAQMQSILGQTGAGDDIRKYMRNQGYDFVAGDPNARKGSITAGDHYVNRNDPTAGPMTAAQAKALQSQEAKDAIAARRRYNAEQIKQGRQQAIQTGKIQGREAGRAFVRDSAARFGKAAGMVGATVGLTMIGGMLSQSAGTNTAKAGLGGAMSGIGMGVGMGAAFGPAGMAAGALIGGAIGLFTGMGNARQQREAEKRQAREFVNETVFGGKTFNRSEDFRQARADAAKLQLDIMKLGDGEGSLKAQIAAIDARRAETIDAETSRVMGAARAEFGDEYDITNDAAALELMGQELIKNKRLTDEYIKDIFGDDGVASSMGELNDAIASVYDTGVGRNDKQIRESLDAERKQLESDIGNLDTANNSLAKALQEITKRENQYNEMVGKTMYTLEGTGVATAEVAALFDELGLSIEETSVGIHEFNRLIGMTGDLAADRATGAGRMGRSLLADSQLQSDLAEGRSRLRQQLEDTFSYTGPMSKDEATIVVGQTVNEIVGNAMAEYAAGNIKFSDLVGVGETPGMLQNQLAGLVYGAAEAGLSPELVSGLADAVFGEGKLIDQANQAKTDPFKRAQFDAVFNQDLTSKMDNLALDFGAKIAEGSMSVPEALESATSELVTWLEDPMNGGLEVTPETESKLKNLLSGTIMNAPQAMTDAMRSAGMDVAAMIRAAMTGATYNPSAVAARLDPSLNPYGGTGNPNIDRPQPVKEPPPPSGDTRTSRFSRVMSAHARLNSMVPGRRIVTSGIRDTMLGSIGSDHSTGSAYDLVGDNLVSYANNVRNVGGFAEFHGGGSGKHLHVVPPVGDTTTSRAGGYGGSSSTNYYNFEISGGPGMDPDDIAEAVMRRIERAERNRRERV